MMKHFGARIESAFAFPAPEGQETREFLGVENKSICKMGHLQGLRLCGGYPNDLQEPEEEELGGNIPPRSSSCSFAKSGNPRWGRVEHQSGGTNGEFSSYPKEQCCTVLICSRVSGPWGKANHKEPQTMYLPNHENEFIKSALKVAHILAHNSSYMEKRLHIKKVNKNRKAGRLGGSVV